MEDQEFETPLKRSKRGDDQDSVEDLMAKLMNNILNPDSGQLGGREQDAKETGLPDR